MADPIYPPLDVPKQAAPDVWVVDSGPISVIGLQLPVRMTVVRLPDGSLLLHSPTQYSPALRVALEAFGPIRHLVLPNIAHWVYAVGWQDAMHGLTTWGAPGVAERGAVRRSPLRLDATLGSVAPSAWGDAIDLVTVPGALGFREVALFHGASRTLVLTDLVQNLEPDKLSPAERVVFTLAGSAGTGRAPLHLRAVVRAGGEPARAAGRRLIALRPSRVIFAHGAWFETNAGSRLERSLRWLTAA